jgi:hypothetical protein
VTGSSRFDFASFAPSVNLQLLELGHKLAGWPFYGRHKTTPLRKQANLCRSKQNHAARKLSGIIKTRDSEIWIYRQMLAVFF